MARLVSCPHCAAPYRVVGVETRFRCDYCRTLVELSWPVHREELVVRTPFPTGAEVRRRARRWLQRLDVRGARIEAGTGCYFPFWHLVSRGGEEHTLAAADLGPLLSTGFVLPAAPMLPREDPLCPRPEPAVELTVSQAEAESAALSTFQDRAPAVERRRLVWVPAIPVQVKGPGWSLDAWFLPGPQRFVAGPLPARARATPPDRARLVGYAGFATVTVLVGSLLAEPIPRLVVESALLASGWLGWRMGFGSRREAR